MSHSNGTKSVEPGTGAMDLIVNFTPTGMIPTKEMTSHVPVSVEEIVEDVIEAVVSIIQHNAK